MHLITFPIVNVPIPVCRLFSLPLGLGLCSSEIPSAITPHFRANTKQ